ncbi:MAG: hypothetical protein WBG36_10260 [Ornithinimicrobium sp.]
MKTTAPGRNLHHLLATVHDLTVRRVGLKVHTRSQLSTPAAGIVEAAIPARPVRTGQAVGRR